MNTRMPSGVVQNMLAAIKLVNAIRLGECKFTADDVQRAGGLRKAMKAMITQDNDRYYRVFENLRQVQSGGQLTRPDLTGYNLPEFTICETENDVTLKKKDYGRGFAYYDVGKLFDGEEASSEPNAGAWKGLLQVVINGWGLAEAAAIHPEQINHWTSCSKKVLRDLRKWSFIRATGYLPPVGEQPGREAKDYEREWAAQPFPALV